MPSIVYDYDEHNDEVIAEIFRRFGRWSDEAIEVAKAKHLEKEFCLDPRGFARTLAIMEDDWFFCNNEFYPLADASKKERIEIQPIVNAREVAGKVNRLIGNYTAKAFYPVFKMYEGKQEKNYFHVYDAIHRDLWNHQGLPQFFAKNYDDVKEFVKNKYITKQEDM